MLPSQAIITNLKQRGISIRDDMNMDDISEILILNDLYAFIVVDELDQLYQNPNENSSLDILYELSYIASIPCGSYCVIACGSSTVLPMLINKSGVHYPGIKEEYPLVVKSPNLNDTKFPSLRLGIGLMTTEEIIPIIQNVMNTDDVSITDINFFRLFCGPNIRKISKMAKTRKLIDDLENYTNPYENQDSKTQKTIKELGEIIKRIYWRLEEANEHLIGDIGYEHTIEDLLYRDWSKLEPIYKLNLENIINECNSLNNGYEYDIIDIYKLVDMNWFTATANLSELYPQTPYQIIYNKLNKNSKNREFTNKLLRGLKENATPIIRKLLIE
jgi:hypothetical protein